MSEFVWSEVARDRSAVPARLLLITFCSSETSLGSLSMFESHLSIVANALGHRRQLHTLGRRGTCDQVQDPHDRPGSGSPAQAVAKTGRRGVFVASCVDSSSRS